VFSQVSLKIFLKIVVLERLFLKTNSRVPSSSALTSLINKNWAVSLMSVGSSKAKESYLESFALLFI